MGVDKTTDRDIVLTVMAIRGPSQECNNILTIVSEVWNWKPSFAMGQLKHIRYILRTTFVLHSFNAGSIRRERYCKKDNNNNNIHGAPCNLLCLDRRLLGERYPGIIIIILLYSSESWAQHCDYATFLARRIQVQIFVYSELAKKS